MKKNDIINVDIIDIGSNGEGVAKVDDIVVFIPFALLGENVDIHILKVNKKIAFAKIKKSSLSIWYNLKPLWPILHRTPAHGRP